MSHPSPTAGGGEFPVYPALQSESLLDCIHCGICLSVCPTYDLTGNEADSPRGRIYTIRALAEGRMELDAAAVAHIDNCLGCLACETACPSAVHYGKLVNEARDQIERWYPRDPRDRLARRALLDLLTDPHRLAPLLFGARLMTGLFGESGGPVSLATRFLFGPSAPRLPIPPDASPRVRPLPEVTPAVGERRARVLFLPGCVMQAMFQEVNRATIRVLAANGCEVVAPRVLGCCGALHLHNGFLDEARDRARALMSAVEGREFDVFVTNSAGCGSALKEYPDLFPAGDAHGDPYERDQAAAFRSRVRDVCEFLVELGPRAPNRPVARRVAYHDACHLAHGQGVRSQPRALLEGIPELTLVEFPQSDWCCGSAGIYNFLQPEMAARLQEKKVGNVLAAAPEILVTGNPGCHAWIEAGLRARGAEVEVLHTLQLLDRAYGPA